VLQSFTVYSRPVLLRPGEVNNHAPDPVQLPQHIQDRFANSTLFIQGYDAEVVDIDDATGEERPLPLYEFYNHHYIMALGTNKAMDMFTQKVNGEFSPGCIGGSHLNHLLRELAENVQLPLGPAGVFGGGSGAEFRHTNYSLTRPYGTPVHNPQALSVLLHFVNTRNSSVEDRRFECPCYASSNHINVQAGTINGKPPMPAFACNAELLQQGNPACSLQTYQGGLRCGEHGAWTVPEPNKAAPFNRMYAKFTFRYYDSEQAVAAQSTDCCDATGNMTHAGNIEYDVPNCPANSPRESCVHEATSIQPIGMPLLVGHQPGHHSNHTPVDPEEEIELIHAVGHQHTGGLGMELYDVRTGRLLCASGMPRYGKGAAAGDEAGFLTGISHCAWGEAPLQPPLRLRRGDLVRTVARYNSTRHHHGVMSLWLIKVVPHPSGNGEEPDILV